MVVVRDKGFRAVGMLAVVIVHKRFALRQVNAVVADQPSELGRYVVLETHKGEIAVVPVKRTVHEAAATFVKAGRAVPERSRAPPPATAQRSAGHRR